MPGENNGVQSASANPRSSADSQQAQVQPAPQELSLKEKSQLELDDWINQNTAVYAGNALSSGGQLVNLQTAQGEASVQVGDTIPGTRIIIEKADDQKAVLKMDDVTSTLPLGGTR